MLRTLEIGLGDVPVALGVEDAVEQPRLPPGVAAGIGRLEDLAGPLHTDAERERGHPAHEYGGCRSR